MEINLLNIIYLIIGILILYACIRPFFGNNGIIEGLKNNKDRVSKLERLINETKSMNEQIIDGLELSKNKKEYIELLTELEDTFNLAIVDNLIRQTELTGDKQRELLKDTELYYKIRDNLPSTVDFLNSFSDTSSTSASGVGSKITGMFS
tara:strand:+ start:996 stop:1445 length:450 start_codon:yes stop_codon:yes gene_type:complete